MAFRIHDSVVRGEIDNRVKGIVRGRIWVEGRAEPLVLELKGNAWPDLAGCLLQFRNPLERVPHQHLDRLNPTQVGTAGDLTASLKVRVSDFPVEEFVNARKPGREHTANCLFLEWFSEANGRVVIESTDYILAISPPEWRMTPDEERQRARDAAGGMTDFLKKFSDAVEQHRRGQKNPEEEWDEHDYEKFMKESDARTDKYMELLDKYGDSEEADAHISREMGWESELTPEQIEKENQRIDEINRACEEALNETEPQPDPLREGIDWIRVKDGDLRHPLQHRCFESALRFWRQADTLGFDKSNDKDLSQFIFEFQTTGAKLAGALNGLARGRHYCDNAFTVAYLKRALDHLHKSQAGLKAVAVKKLLPERLISQGRTELFEIREAILKLMDEFRGRK